MDGYAVVAIVGNRGEWFEREMQPLLGAKGMFEDARSGREGLVHIATPQPEIESNIGALAALEVLEIGESPGRLEFVVYHYLVFRRLDLIENRGQFFVVGSNLLYRLLRDMRIARENDRNRLPHEVYLVDGKDRLIVKRRTVIWIRDYLAHVFAGVNGKDPRQLTRRTDIHCLDTAMCHGAAKNPRMQHAGHLHDVCVFSAAGDFFACLDARQRSANLSAGSGRCHHATSCIAARTARAT